MPRPVVAQRLDSFAEVEGGLPQRILAGDDALYQRDGKGKSSLLAPRSRAHGSVTRSVARLPATGQM